MKKIFIAFTLNLLFSLFEFFGGLFSGSIAILSDSLHDLGDALTIGASVFLEKKSKKPADKFYNLGYGRFSLLGGFITSLVLLAGSAFTFYNGILRFFNPREINTNLMLIFAILGFIVNLFATLFTRHGHTHNHKTINLHMLEDLFGWVAVLVGAVVMKLTDLTFIDSLISIILSIFIFVSALKEIKEIFSIFLLKCPIPYEKVEDALKNFNHSDLKIIAIDEFNICAYLQISDDAEKAQIQEVLNSLGINKVVIGYKKA